VLSYADDAAGLRTLERRLIHLRSGAVREWSDFPETPDGPRLDVTFEASKNAGEQTLMLRQQDVKQQWFVVLNGKRLGELTRDENDMTIAFAIPADALRDGANALGIEPAPSAKTPSDDIRVGQVTLRDQPLHAVLHEATIEVKVVDEGTPTNLPCRITVIDANGSLATLGAAKISAAVTGDGTAGNAATGDGTIGIRTNGEAVRDDGAGRRIEVTPRSAVRPGTVYSSTGRVTIGLPAGQYTIYAGRGFEYSIAQCAVSLAAGATVKETLSIRREVPTSGYVACDTHVHTLTHSGHGDASIAERMITLAGEGIELPVATDHNVHVDYDPIAGETGVRRHFTPVIGNEVTTPRGHFNIFPVQAGARVPDFKQTDWRLLFDDIDRTPGVKVVILNHARDLHSGVRPFGPALHNALVGENLDGWPLRFNGMEVVNSGATQTDVLRLFHDWMGLLNAGHRVTPVGSSDSHDVARHFVGQGRTYIRCDDRGPGILDVDAAVNNFLRGRVMVSYGLLAELTVNGKYSSGELATTPDDEVRVDVRVLGPHWVEADRVLLFANGRLIRDEAIPSNVDRKPLPLGVKWTGSWTIPRPKHDVHLVAIALGPGVDGLYWKTAKPYQPASTDATTHVIGCSGAVWLDVDGDGRPTAARDYAARLIADDRGDVQKLIPHLAGYDEATAAQAAHLLRVSGVPLHDERLQTALPAAAQSVQSGFRQYQEAWRENEIARSQR
jgi:hypothetical protein